MARLHHKWTNNHPTGYPHPNGPFGSNCFNGDHSPNAGCSGYSHGVSSNHARFSAYRTIHVNADASPHYCSYSTANPYTGSDTNSYPYFNADVGCSRHTDSIPGSHSYSSANPNTQAGTYAAPHTNPYPYAHTGA